MAVAIPLLWAEAATSQCMSGSTVNNDQTQSGAVDSEQTLNVDTVTDQTVATTTSTGNAYTGAVDGSAVDVESTQELQAAVTANAAINVNTNISAATQLTTTATGNAGEAAATDGGGLTGAISQDAGPILVRANEDIQGPTAQGGDVSAVSSATANNQGLGTDGGSINVGVTQTSSATVEADGGAVLQYSPGTASFTAVAVSNNITSTGTDTSTQTLDLSQTMTGDHTQATKFVTFGNGQTVDADATASSDNISISNDTGPLTVFTTQDNEGYVFAESEASSYQFGQVSSSASAVGNSMIAGESGQSLTLTNFQTNNGAGVQATVTVGGNTGFDIAGSSSAFGNSATGYACTTCGGQITVTNSQINTAGVGASTTVNVDGTARSVNSVATAVGNSGTFYVSKPGS